MNKKRLLIQLQLSSYDTNGIWDLATDSGFQMMFGRIREILKLVPSIQIDVIGPRRNKLKAQPETIVPTLFTTEQLHWIEIDIIPNALATRYDFNFEQLKNTLMFDHKEYGRYTHVFLNDPMLLRHYQTLFFIVAKYRPHFTVHSHFIDNPEQPKFPQEASLWMGQIEAAYKADLNFWQCESAMNLFFESASRWITPEILETIRQKSTPWDDGYSSEEINSSFDLNNVRFDLAKTIEKFQGKTIIFVPNRIGGTINGVNRSSDYTRCGHFVFNVVPELWKLRQDFVVICGNPNQKITNDEIAERCPAYHKLVEDSFNRDEYKCIARCLQDITLGFYVEDAYGSTASRELLDMGSIPLWVNLNEYKSIAQEVDWPSELMIDPTLSNAVEITDKLISFYKKSIIDSNIIEQWHEVFNNAVYKRCAYESTTKNALQLMGVI